ncbi:MAG: DNA (cytosine-5-)-methyltransferase [Bacteroides sp.]|nr:DNA (cytosine-5-)-methyltransferase [Bacteroides sp.]MCM1531048.1 DNA (cytosine-5-)-methyltransferase [Ruminococcus flavefaciens]MCM1554959.1 DNA (cytosine-5-)-methyltransferase [Bacteroides sp.]
MCQTISVNNFADLLGVSRSTVETWISNGRYIAHTDKSGKRFFYLEQISDVPEIASMVSSNWDAETQTQAQGFFTSAELFAGAGGLALGMQNAGFHHLFLNELDHTACETLRLNRPDWNIVEGDIHEIDFSPLKDKIDFLSGGFPCQAFSYAGKRLGFAETRGTLFFELARAVDEIQPKVFLCENVRGLLEHDNGRTLQTIKNVIAELGYTLIEPRILRAIQYNVPQKRERLILIAIRNDLAPFVHFTWPDVCPSIPTLRDAFYKGRLFDCDVPESPGQQYPESKKKVMELVPEGGDWRDLPEQIAREYMKGSYGLGGGKTGMARRLSLDEPSLTLTCAPAQKQTERCHPLETRPLTVREYARIQTFPDSWKFCGNLSAQYKQIGNAVPVNLAWAIGRSIIRLFNEMIDLGLIKPSELVKYQKHQTRLHGLFEGMVCDNHTYRKTSKSRTKKER